jgi:hypothetical protein
MAVVDSLINQVTRNARAHADCRTLTRFRFTKKVGEGAPVRLIAADDPTEAAAVREVDLQKRFHLSATQLARALELTTHKSHALRQKLRIDADPQCMHTFTFGKSKHPMFSDNATTRMQEAQEAMPAEP